MESDTSSAWKILLPKIYNKNAKTPKYNKNINKSYKCDICEKIFPKRKYLLRHVHTVHVKTKSIVAINKEYTCDICHKLFTAGSFKQNVHEGQKEYKCERCGKEFGQLGNLKIHIKNVHNEHKV